jgi:serine protease Do
MKNNQRVFLGAFLALILVVGVSALTTYGTIQWLDSRSEWTMEPEFSPELEEPAGASTLEGAVDGEQERAAPPVRQRRERRLGSLRDLNEAMVDIAEKVRPSVVTVFTERVMTVQMQNPFFGPFGGGGGSLFDQFFRDFMGPQPGQPQAPREEERRQQGLGSGVVISKEGFIITNNHVIEGADEIKVRFFNDKTLVAKVIGTDSQTDIAVIQVEADDLIPIRVGSSADLRVGEIVLAVGSPMSSNLAHTVTQGIVSAKGRSNVGLADYEDFIQTDAAVNPGNSGGALVNLDGELVGINTAIVSRSGGFQGISFAVPIDMARQVQESLMASGRVVRGWLGVAIQDVSEEIAKAMDLPNTRGILVSDLTDGGPAEKAGLQSGDVIVGFQGNPVSSGTQLRNRIASTAPGTEVSLRVWREGKEIDLKAKLEALPSELAEGPAASSGESEEFAALGFSVADLTNSLRQQLKLNPRVNGVVITEINRSSAAAQAGLRPQDVILSVNRSPVTSVSEFRERTRGVKKGQSLLLQIARGQGSLFVAFSL